MLQIISDSSALYNKQEAREAGFYSVPLQVIVDGESFEDFETISSAQMNEACRQKKSVSTSQPSIGAKLDLYNELLQDPDNQILDITMAKGLSGTYHTALMAKDACDDPDRVTVINSGTLCGPQRQLVKKAIEMRDAGKSLEEIVRMIETSQKTELSTVTVPDVAFVLKGGRLGSWAGKAGEFLRLMPIVKKTAEDEGLGVLSAARTFKKAFSQVEGFFVKRGFDDSYILSITHADNPVLAQKAAEFFQEKYPDLKIEIRDLCPLFIVHGGPGCIALQAIQISES